MTEIKGHRPLVMVTGANGFVGEALVASLITKDFVVRRSVRQMTFDFSDDESVFVSGDINESTKWMDGLVGVDVIVHTAARVHVMDEQSLDPLAEFRRVNVLGSVNLARQASRAGVKRFIYLSSVKVNGEVSASGCSFEASDPPRPLGAYAVSKSEAEVELLRVATETGLEVVIIRPPLVYGPGVKANFALLIRTIRMGVPLPFGKVTENRRSMVSLDNLVDFVTVCLDNLAASNEIFMISDGHDISTADLITRISKALGKKVFLIPIPVSFLGKIAFIFGKKDFMERLTGNLQVDIDKNIYILNWRPKGCLDESLMKALNDTKS
jgi:nucleoside-diphosphate-sugar epimerase